jgi:hypothetical protein
MWRLPSCAFLVLAALATASAFPNITEREGGPIHLVVRGALIEQFVTATRNNDPFGVQKAQLDWLAHSTKSQMYTAHVAAYQIAHATALLGGPKARDECLRELRLAEKLRDELINRTEVYSLELAKEEWDFYENSHACSNIWPARMT